MERARAAALAERAAQILTHGGTYPDQRHVVELIWWAGAHVDLAVVDEALGYCAGLDSPPRTVTYLAKTIKNWAAQREVDMPTFDTRRRSA